MKLGSATQYTLARSSKVGTDFALSVPDRQPTRRPSRCLQCAISVLHLRSYRKNRACGWVPLAVSLRVRGDRCARPTRTRQQRCRTEDAMNKNQITGTVKDIAGQVQRKIGEATGSANQQVKGGAKQVEGKLQKGAGDAQQAAENANKGKI